MRQRAATRRLPNLRQPAQPSLAVAVFVMPSSTPSLLDRDEMVDRVVRQVSERMGAPVIEQERINCHPSHRTAVAPLRDAVEPVLWAHRTQKEEHFGKGLWLSRMGAISARFGELRLIPGSMGTAAYVVDGLGDPVALRSSPHGAGREHSRSVARKTFTASELRTAMEGIEHRDTDAFITRFLRRTSRLTG